MSACPLRDAADAVIVDVHAEATSEKEAFGWFLDGRASLVVGTHTHVPTADHRILPGGTAYMSDVGMCGDYDSVSACRRTSRCAASCKKPLAAGSKPPPARALCGIAVETDDATGLARRVSPCASGRISRKPGRGTGTEKPRPAGTPGMRVPAGLIGQAAPGTVPPAPAARGRGRPSDERVRPAMAASAASPPLTSPRIYLIRMVVFLTLAGFLAFVLFRQIVPAFMANPGLNGLILGATLIAIIMAFGQVQRLFREVRFANRTATGAADPGTPVVLSALVRRSRGAGRTAASARPVPAAPRQRRLAARRGARDPALYRRPPDPARPARHLLGPDRHTVGGGRRDPLDAAGGGDAAVMFDELKSGLAVPLSGIGLAFSASLFGLAGSLVIGFLDLQAGQAHTRFYNELEDWLVTAAGPAPAPVPVPVTVSAAAALGAVPPRPPEPAPRSEAVLKDIADAMTRLGTLVGDSTAHGRASTQAMANLAEGIQGLVQHMRAEQQMIRDWVEAQATRERELKQVLDRLAREKVE